MISHCVPAGSPWATNQMTVPGLDPTTTVFLDAALGAGNRRGRVIYFPSTGGFANQINLTGQTAILQSFQTTMTQDGWQVLSVDEDGARGSSISTDVPNDAGGGTRALQSQLHYLDHIMMWAAQKYGGHMPTIIAGFSYGAWSTLAVTMNRGSNIVGFISRSSAVQWNAYPTDGVILYPALNGVNTSGINLTTNSNVTLTSAPTVSGGNATLTTTGNFATAGITSGTVVSISNTGGAQGTYGDLVGSYTVNSGATATSISVPYSGAALTQPTTTVVSGTLNQTPSIVQVAGGGVNGFNGSGTFQVNHSGTNYTVTYTGTNYPFAYQFTGCTIASGSVTLSSGDVVTGLWQNGLYVSTNTYLNSCTVPGIVMYGNSNELIQWEQLNTMATNAINNGAPITNILMNGEGHTWTPADTALMCGSTYSGTVSYLPYQVVYYSGNAYTCILASTGNLPTNATYFTLIGTQSAQGWVQTTLDPYYPKVY